MSETDVLDRSALERLREWGGDKLLGQMIRLFLENAPGRMSQIREGAAKGDISGPEKGAHSLKSGAANVGAVHLRTVAADMERAAASGDEATVQELLPSMEAAFTLAIQALEEAEKGLDEKIKVE